MGRRPKSDQLITIPLNDGSIEIAESVLFALPGAARFLAWLVNDERLSQTLAARYTRLVASARRDGSLTNPDAIAREPHRTAAKRWTRWAAGAYDERMRLVVQHWVKRGELGVASELRAAGNRARISSLLPPAPDKRIPREDIVATRARWEEAMARIRAAGPHGDPGVGSPNETRVISWEPCPDRWTLHIPHAAGTPVHLDPCSECYPLVLDDEGLQVIANAFRDAWGDRHPSTLPGDALLFGPPPLAGTPYANKPVPFESNEYTLALAGGGPLSYATERQGGTVVATCATFLEKFRERTPRVVSFDMRNNAELIQTVTAFLAMLHELAQTTPSPAS